MNTPPPESPLPAKQTPDDDAVGVANDVEERNGVVFYRGSRPFEQLEFPPETAADTEDYDWAIHDSQVRQEHGGLIVAVRGRKVWGAGKNPRAAWEQACKVPDCPPLDELLFVAIPGPALGGGEGKH
jgi:hypothetical protein